MARRVHRPSRAVVYLLLLRQGSIHLQSWVVSGSASARGAMKLGAIEYRMRELQLLVEWDAEFVIYGETWGVELATDSLGTKIGINMAHHLTTSCR